MFTVFGFSALPKPSGHPTPSRQRQKTKNPTAGLAVGFSKFVVMELEPDCRPAQQQGVKQQQILQIANHAVTDTASRRGRQIEFFGRDGRQNE